MMKLEIKEFEMVIPPYLQKEEMIKAYISMTIIRTDFMGFDEYDKPRKFAFAKNRFAELVLRSHFLKDEPNPEAVIFLEHAEDLGEYMEIVDYFGKEIPKNGRNEYAYVVSGTGIIEIESQKLYDLIDYELIDETENQKRIKVQYKVIKADNIAN